MKIASAWLETLRGAVRENREWLMESLHYPSRQLAVIPRGRPSRTRCGTLDLARRRQRLGVIPGSARIAFAPDHDVVIVGYAFQPHTVVVSTLSRNSFRTDSGGKY